MSVTKTHPHAYEKSFLSLDLLLAVAFATDLFAPFLIRYGILPAYARWVSHAAVAMMTLGAYARMMVFDRVPGVVWVIVANSAIGVTVALCQGQGIVPTAWGWWIMFQFPLVGLYAYLQPKWPDRFPQRLRTACAFILGMQVIVQTGQYVTGESIGDGVSGTFGPRGTGDLVVFALLVLCLVLGHWLAHREWQALVLVLGMGIFVAVLGGMKFYPFAALALGVLSSVVFIFQTRRLWKLVPYVVLIGTVVVAFIGFYNLVRPTALSLPLEKYLEPQTFIKYTHRADRTLVQGKYYYDIGRNYALAYGWNSILSDPTTFLFGMGLGARGESRSLGTAGAALLRGNLGLATGTSLLVIMQEVGLVGMVVLGCFIVWTVVVLFKGVKNYPQSNAVELRYGLLLFSLLWPLWLWYNTAWINRPAMLIYWSALGYVLSEPDRHGIRTQQRPRFGWGNFRHHKANDRFGLGQAARPGASKHPL